MNQPIDMTRFFRNLLFAASVFLTSCAMSNTYVHVTQKPVITLPEHVKSIAIVDRTGVAKKDKLKNALEGMISGERLGQDRQGEQAVVSGLASILQSSPDVLPHMTNLRLVGSGKPNIFPYPLDTTSIHNICHDFNADAVASLESFDSNSGYKYITIKFGFRLYDGSSKTMLDNYYDVYTVRRRHIHSYSYKYRNQNTALIAHAGFDAGINYGRRISTTQLEVTRKYFRTGNDQMKAAGRKAHLGNWQEAAEAWQQVVQNGDRKNAGRAAYNLALVSEMQGDLPQAQTWIGKAYGDYNNKQARTYGEIINERLMHMKGSGVK